MPATLVPGTVWLIVGMELLTIYSLFEVGGDYTVYFWEVKLLNYSILHRYMSMV